MKWSAFLILASCAHFANNPCDIPPQNVLEFVRVDCQTFTEYDAKACTYVGWRDERLCASVVVSMSCGEWNVVETACDISWLGAFPSSSEPSGLGTEEL